MKSWSTSKFMIRTSGRRTFRRCLRKWGFQSSMRMNLERAGTETNIHFWFGSAIHFAMEDYFGWNKFGDPRRALKAYYDAFKEEDLPMGAAMHYDLGVAMLTYLLEWYPKHNNDMQFETLWLDENNKQVPPHTEGARPAIEESFTLDLGIKLIVEASTGNIIRKYREEDAHSILRQQGPNGEEIMTLLVDKDDDMVFVEVVLVPVCYHGTMDRLVVDRFGRWWILDYKTAKSADVAKLDTDDQISSYLWAGEQWFQHKIHGFVYLQLTKDTPKPPKRLKDGTLSVDKKQKTTHQLFKQEVIVDYGEVRKAPKKVIDMLNHLAEQDTPEGDRFVRWDFVTRTDAQKVSTYNHVMGEVEEMINPNKYLYPTPTRDCAWDCNFREICIALDDGREDDAQMLIDRDYGIREDQDETNHDPWRVDIKWPEEPLPAVTMEELKIEHSNIFNIELPPEYYTNNYEEED